MTESNLPVRTLSTGEKSLIVHKHWTTATTLTALIPFCLATFPQSLVLCLWLARWRPNPPHTPPFLRNAKFRAMTYRRIWLEKKACVYMVCAYSDHLSRDCYCCYIELWNPVLRKSHMRIHLNWGQWRCCTDWKSWVSTVCGMPRLKLWRCNWNCMCVWARYAVYSVCVLTIFSVYCRCTPIIGLGERKHGQAGPKTAARTAFYCYSSFFFIFFFCCVIDWAINIIMYTWPTSINFFLHFYLKASNVTITHHDVAVQESFF